METLATQAVFDKRQRDTIAHAAWHYLRTGNIERMKQCGFYVYPFAEDLERIRCLREKIIDSSYPMMMRVILSWEVYCAQERFFSRNRPRFGWPERG